MSPETDGILRAAILAAIQASFGCAADARLEASPPRVVEGISVAACVEGVSDGAPVPRDRCPGFLVEFLESALEICRGAEGTLVPGPASRVWALDVDADGRDEFALEHEGAVGCDGAWSVFSCGSLGCPTVLYRERNGAWHGIAALPPGSPAAIEILPTGSDGFRDLRVRRDGAEFGGESSTFAWRGDAYAFAYIETHGVRVEVEGSIHGLHPLEAETEVLESPSREAAVLARYGAGTEVAVVGTAEGGEYFYVSPCNARARGFIPRSAIRMR